MRKSEYIGITRKYKPIDKKEIKKKIAQKNVDYLYKYEIIDEDYNDLFEVINKTENENENKNSDGINKRISVSFTTNFKSKFSQSKLYDSNENIISSFSPNKSPIVPKLTFSNQDLLKLKLKNRVSSPLDRKTLDTLFSNISKTFKLQSPSDISEEMSESQVDSADENSIEFNRQILSSIRDLKRNKLKKSNQDKLNSASTIHNLISNKPKEHLHNSQSNLQFYSGEYDVINFLYCGTGNLIKNNKKNYYYHGTFRIGKKHGYGILYKFLSDTEYEFYRGEWTNNKQDGFGIQIILNEQNKKKVFKKGTFEMGKFVSGIQLTIEEKNNEIFIEEYQGNKMDNNFSGEGILSRKILKANKFDSSKFDIDYEYIYNGYFVDNLESGNGVARKFFKQQKYQYEYKGEFYKGEMHGSGKIEYTGDYYIKSYEGIFENDKCFCVYGIVKFQSGDQYEGFFDKKNLKTNVGLYIHHDKDHKKENFFGRFYNDKKDGLGRFVSPRDFKVFAGIHIDGEKNGIYTLTCNVHQEVNFPNETKMQTYPVYNNFHSSCNSLNTQYPTEKRFNLYYSIDTNFMVNSKSLRTELIKQSKNYYMFENDELIDKSDRPIKE